jgi:RNA polymerase sigma factor (sigma-70 family)
MVPEPQDTEARISPLIARLQEGDRTVIPLLIEHAQRRLTALTRRLLRGDRLRRWHETGDVVQSALVRLLRALNRAPPESPRHFFHLATEQIRRQLKDLARHDFGPQGDAGHHASDPRALDSGGVPRPRVEAAPAPADHWDRLDLIDLGEQVLLLPADEQEVFDLMFYQGLSQDEAAAILGTSVSTVKRCWRRARLSLHKKLGGRDEPPAVGEV